MSARQSARTYNVQPNADLLARNDVVPTRTEPVTARAARKLQAAVLTMPNRKKLVWNNYREGKCGLDK